MPEHRFPRTTPGGRSHFDRLDLHCFGSLASSALSQDQLHEFWAAHHG